MAKGIKKIVGALIMFVFGIACISAAACFFLTLIGKIPVSSIGERLFMLVAYLAYFAVTLSLFLTGWCYWNDVPVNKFIRKFLDRKKKLPVAIDDTEFETLDEEEKKALKRFLVEDTSPFAAYSIETLYYDKLKNGTNVEQFYLVPEDVTAEMAIRQYQKYLEWRKQYFNQKDSIPKKVHIRVMDEKALIGCDDFYYKQCLKAGMHIVMHKGPYTLLDVTRNKEYKVMTETENSPGEIVGTWSFK